MPAPLVVADLPEIPLARTIAMPDRIPYPTGAVGVRLTGLSLTPTVAMPLPLDPGATVGLGPLLLAGRCVILVRPDPVIDIDTAGDLSPLPTSGEPAGAQPDGEPDPRMEEWLDQARAERDRLSASANGQRLLDVYDEHSEVYDEVFRKSATMREVWRAGGVTRQMAADTSAALRAGESTAPGDAAVNSRRYQRSDTGETVTYNQNAFLQQLAVTVQTGLSDDDWDPLGDADARPAPRYLAAMKASLSFGKGVSRTTGNDKNTVVAVTGQEVHQVVVDATEPPPEVTDDEALAVLNASTESGGASAALDWLRLDEADLDFLRDQFAAGLRERAQRSDVVAAVLFDSPCSATIAGARLVRTADGRSVSVALPAFALDIDDADWDGPAADVARERLARTYFLQTLLHDAVAARLQTDAEST